MNYNGKFYLVDVNLMGLADNFVFLIKITKID